MSFPQGIMVAGGGQQTVIEESSRKRELRLLKNKYVPFSDLASLTLFRLLKFKS